MSLFYKKSKNYLDTGGDAIGIEVDLEDVAEGAGGRGESGVESEFGVAKGLAHLKSDGFSGLSKSFKFNL